MGLYGELIRRLPEVEFVIFEPSDCPVASWFNSAANVTARRTPIPSTGRARKAIEGGRYWRRALANERLDIFEGFNLPFVKSPSGRTMQTIHDVRRLSPDWALPERTAYKFFFKRALAQVDHLITVSETMKAEILSFYPDVEISVVYNGLAENAFDSVSVSDLIATQKKFALPSKFILAVGHLEPRKNYLGLIDAIAWLRDAGEVIPLVIVGNESGLRKVIEESIQKKRLSDSVKILSNLGDRELYSLYKLCDLFVFPSFYEGFGIPIVEAMGAGCPMILSDIPVFRELTQDKCTYFSPHDSSSIALAIQRVLQPGSQAPQIVKYGHERVKQFGFNILGSQMEKLYRSMA
ncbi:glycosyltransferase family 4 protein [Mesorhizobium sp. M0959]